MVILSMLIGVIFGGIVGSATPIIPYTFSKYLAISIIAALDSVFGGINSNLNGKFDLKIFVSGFFMNAIISILLTYLGERLNVDIYLAAIFVFVGRIFNNLGFIRRYYIEKWLLKSKKIETEK